MEIFDGIRTIVMDPANQPLNQSKLSLAWPQYPAIAGNTNCCGGFETLALSSGAGSRTLTPIALFLDFQMGFIVTLFDLRKF
jgi:hypothetical protein